MELENILREPRPRKTNTAQSLSYVDPSFDILNLHVKFGVSVEVTKLKGGIMERKPEQWWWGEVLGVGRRGGVKKRRDVWGRRVYENEGCKKIWKLTIL